MIRRSRKGATEEYLAINGLLEIRRLFLESHICRNIFTLSYILLWMDVAMLVLRQKFLKLDVRLTYL